MPHLLTTSYMMLPATCYICVYLGIWVRPHVCIYRNNISMHKTHATLKSNKAATDIQPLLLYQTELIPYGHIEKLRFFSIRDGQGRN